MHFLFHNFRSLFSRFLEQFVLPINFAFLPKILCFDRGKFPPRIMSFISANMITFQCFSSFIGSPVFLGEACRISKLRLNYRANTSPHILPLCQAALQFAEPMFSGNSSHQLKYIIDFLCSHF